jgi:hypothetical protein
MRKPLSALYLHLIEAAERQLRHTEHSVALPDIALLRDLRDAVAQAISVPSDGQALIFSEELDLAAALVSIALARRHREAARMQLYQQLAGVLLPVVRGHCADAVMMRARAATTNQNYPGR